MNFYTLTLVWAFILIPQEKKSLSLLIGDYETLVYCDLKNSLTKLIGHYETLLNSILKTKPVNNLNNPFGLLILT